MFKLEPVSEAVHQVQLEYRGLSHLLGFAGSGNKPFPFAGMSGLSKMLGCIAPGWLASHCNSSFLRQE